MLIFDKSRVNSSESCLRSVYLGAIGYDWVLRRSDGGPREYCELGNSNNNMCVLYTSNP